VQKAF